MGTCRVNQIGEHLKEKVGFWVMRHTGMTCLIKEMGKEGLHSSLAQEHSMSQTMPGHLLPAVMDEMLMKNGAGIHKIHTLPNTYTHLEQPDVNDTFTRHNKNRFLLRAMVV